MNQDEREMLLKKIAEVERRLQKAQMEKEAAEKKAKEYKEKIRKAEDASRMKSLFLANMSHEIRIPMNAIEDFSRIIAKTDSVEERIQFLETIESNNERLNYLINEMLDLSKVETGDISIKKSETDLNQLCKSINQIFRFKCPDTVNLVNEAPSVAITMNTDANRLMQVFSNLVNNALKHTDKGDITFGYRLTNDAQEIEFYVSDTGTGISEEDMEKIFRTYVSKDAETENCGNSLSLALSKIIVEKMGGSMSVQSTVGMGTTFIFSLPFEGDIEGNERGKSVTTTSPTLRMTTTDVNRNAKLILIAEDEDSNYELLRNALARQYRLLRARNGIEAVTLNEEENPDLILMDICMPDMDGMEATRIIKEKDSDTPIIVLSAYAFDDSIHESRMAGCDEFFAKPIKISVMIDTIRKYLKE